MAALFYPTTLEIEEFLLKLETDTLKPQTTENLQI